MLSGVINTYVKQEKWTCIVMNSLKLTDLICQGQAHSGNKDYNSSLQFALNLLFGWGRCSGDRMCFPSDYRDFLKYFIELLKPEVHRNASGPKQLLKKKKKKHGFRKKTRWKFISSITFVLLKVDSLEIGEL